MLVVHMIKFDPTGSSNQILFISMLQIKRLRYSRHFLITKCVCFKLILFVINLDVVSSSKVLTLLILCFYGLYD